MGPKGWTPSQLSLAEGFWGPWRFAPREPGLSQFGGSPRVSESKQRERGNGAGAWSSLRRWFPREQVVSASLLAVGPHPGEGSLGIRLSYLGDSSRPPCPFMCPHHRPQRKGSWCPPATLSHLSHLCLSLSPLDWGEAQPSPRPEARSSASTCPYILMTINYCFCCEAIDTRLMQVGFGFLFFFKFLIKSKKTNS